MNTVYTRNEMKHIAMLANGTTRDSGVLRQISWFVLLLFLNAVVWPSWAVALEADQRKQQQEEMRWERENRSLHQVLGNLKDHVKNKREQVLDEVNTERGFMSRALGAIGLGQDAIEDSDGKRYLQTLNSLKSEVELSLETDFETLQEKGVDDVILQRQQEYSQKILSRYQQVQQQLQAATEEQSLQEQQENIDQLQQTLEDYQTRKPRDPFDPNRLPWRITDPESTPLPADDAKQLSQRYKLPLFEQGPMLAANVITADMLGNPGGPTQADLNSTLDAPLNEAIVAKANELNNDPVEIYQWVRNNIEYIPSYGSIQGAEYTLKYGKGNAFDTSSLLVALLRAANVPARYAFGTVRVPVGQVMNWVGNVQAPESAGHLLGQGGVPSVALTSGGQITHYKLEHVWVEAWIDYLPSRGAKHSKGDTWIPMDASFKQYEYTEGMKLEEQVPFDAQSLVDTIEQNSTINEDEGWVQNVPQSDVEQALADYQAQLQQYIENQNPDATVGEVLGTSSIKTVIRESLAASLPYELMTRKLVASSLTDNQRWKFQYTLGTSLYGQMGSTLLSINKPTVELAGKKLSLSYSPASDVDAETIASYLPEPDENGEIDPAAIPDTLPGYLINLIAEFSIGNEVIASSGAMTMGTELLSEMGYRSPSWGLETTQNKPVAGEFRAIALDLQGISAAQAAALKADLETTQAKLTAEDFTDLGKQQLVGDLLYSTILSYFALNNFQDELTARAANMVSFKAPSYGLFKTNLKPQYWFGVPRNVVIDGLVMDVDHIEHQVVERNNDQERWKAYNRANGARMSAMEHMVPELMFSTEESPAHGISAVKAIQIAAAEGQKIWTITQANLSTALAAIDLPSDIETDIRNSVYAGKEVTAHETAVNFYGSSQVGYVVIDPTTGAGGYLIGGGENGGFIALGYTLQVGSVFVSFLDSYSSAFGSVIPIFGTISRFLTMATFTYGLLSTGASCMGDLAPVIFVTMIFQLLALLIGMLFGAIFNPLVAFALNLAIDRVSSWFLSLAQNCRT